MHTRRRLLTLAASMSGAATLAACGGETGQKRDRDALPEERSEEPAAQEEPAEGKHLTDLDDEQRSSWGEGGTAVELACAQNVPTVGEEFVLGGEFGRATVTMRSLELHEGDLSTEHTNGTIDTDEERTHVLALEAEMRALDGEVELEVDFFNLGTEAPSGSEWANWGTTGDRRGALEADRLPPVLPADEPVIVRHFGDVPHSSDIEYRIEAPFGSPFQGDAWILDADGRDRRAQTAERARAAGGGTIALSRALARAVITRAQWLDALHDAVPANGAFLQLEVTVSVDGLLAGGEEDFANPENSFALVLPAVDASLEDERSVLDTTGWNDPPEGLVLEPAHPRDTELRLAPGDSATFTVLFDAPRTDSFSILDATEPRGTAVPGSLWSTGGDAAG